MKVTTNNFQRRIKELTKGVHSPGIKDIHSVQGVLIKVYDQEYLAQNSGEERFTRKDHPGLVFGRVMLPNRREVVLPFKETEDQIHSTYGNYLALQGRKCLVEYNGAGNLLNGYISFTRDTKTKQVDLGSASTVLDIGAIV